MSMASDVLRRGLERKFHGAFERCLPIHAVGIRSGLQRRMPPVVRRKDRGRSIGDGPLPCGPLGSGKQLA